MNIEEIRLRGERIAILAMFAETLSPEQADKFFHAMQSANFISETACKLLAEHVHREKA